jgi:hypothetical protein
MDSVNVDQESEKVIVMDVDSKMHYTENVAALR